MNKSNSIPQLPQLEEADPVPATSGPILPDIILDLV